MPDLKKVLAGLENCTDNITCRDCPWEDCVKTDCERVNMPRSLVVAAMKLIRHQNEKIISLKRERAILKEKTQVVHCKDCAFWTPYNAEESDTSGRCQSRYGVCEGQTTDMMWYCADGMKEET